MDVYRYWNIECQPKELNNFEAFMIIIEVYAMDRSNTLENEDRSFWKKIAPVTTTEVLMVFFHSFIYKLLRED